MRLTTASGLTLYIGNAEAQQVGAGVTPEPTNNVLPVTLPFVLGVGNG